MYLETQIILLYSDANYDQENDMVRIPFGAGVCPNTFVSD